MRIDKSRNNASYADCQQSDKSPCYGNSAMVQRSDKPLRSIQTKDDKSPCYLGTAPFMVVSSTDCTDLSVQKEI
ncbi:MAG: hypothetical protein KAU06_09685 [Candidatus Marinimicrobia bacterium]|nr:hypothetical protein [Candidatus Neomarinimicrobiota bacterium]